MARKELTDVFFISVVNTGVTGELRSFDSRYSLRTRILVGCSVTVAFFVSVASIGVSGEWLVASGEKRS